MWCLQKASPVTPARQQLCQLALYQQLSKMSRGSLGSLASIAVLSRIMPKWLVPWLSCYVAVTHERRQGRKWQKQSQRQSGRGVRTRTRHSRPSSSIWQDHQFSVTRISASLSCWERMPVSKGLEQCCVRNKNQGTSGLSHMAVGHCARQRKTTVLTNWSFWLSTGQWPGSFTIIIMVPPASCSPQITTLSRMYKPLPSWMLWGTDGWHTSAVTTLLSITSPGSSTVMQTLFQDVPLKFIVHQSMLCWTRVTSQQSVSP